jgi:hypothetical protein
VDSYFSPITVLIRLSLNLILIKVFSTGNIYPATCSSAAMKDYVHWNRPPILSHLLSVYRLIVNL